MSFCVAPFVAANECEGSTFSGSLLYSNLHVKHHKSSAVLEVTPNSGLFQRKGTMLAEASVQASIMLYQ